MNINQAFPSNYVKAADLEGQSVNVMIRDVLIEDVSGDGTEAKPVCYFQGMTKGLVLNKTNACAIAGAYGDETDNWRGQPITLFPTVTNFKGKPVDCIRVRVDAQPPVAPLTTPAPVQPATQPQNNNGPSF